jgi:hypothetical protein
MGIWVKRSAPEYEIILVERTFCSFSLEALQKPLIQTLEENTLIPVPYTQQAYSRKLKKLCR